MRTMTIDWHARVAEAVDVEHGSARRIREVQVLVWRDPRAPLEVRAPLQPLEAHHVAIGPNLDTAGKMLSRVDHATRRYSKTMFKRLRSGTVWMLSVPQLQIRCLTPQSCSEADSQILQADVSQAAPELRIRVYLCGMPGCA